MGRYSRGKPRNSPLIVTHSYCITKIRRTWSVCLLASPRQACRCRCSTLDGISRLLSSKDGCNQTEVARRQYTSLENTAPPVLVGVTSTIRPLVRGFPGSSHPRLPAVPGSRTCRRSARYRRPFDNDDLFQTIDLLQIRSAVKRPTSIASLLLPGLNLNLGYARVH